MTVSWTRRVVPQWVRSTDPEIRFVRKEGPASSPTGGILALDQAELGEALAEFDANPSIGLAADALRFAYHSKFWPELRRAAEFVAATSDRLPDALRRLANSVIHQDLRNLTLHGEMEHTKPMRYAIHDTRRWLARFPHDALSWLDLGRLQAATGNTEGASSSVRTALSLRPTSRTVLRAASRFFLHARDPEKAFHVLDRSSRTSSDPWLMAGHIAISSILDKTSRHAKKGRQLVASQTLPPQEITELASSLATVALESGSTREARRLFNVSLQQPNENSLAQAEWAVDQLNIAPDLPGEWLENPASSEAGYYHQLFNNNFDAALRNAVRWHHDEPFASRPMLAASFIAGISGAFDDSCDFARQGLVTEPDNVMLLNNLAFAIGARGDVQGAERILARIGRLEKRDLSAHTLANLGMLSYLRGEYELGRNLYESAIRQYKKLKRLEEAAVAATFEFRFAKQTAANGWEFTQRNAQAVVEESRSRLASAIYTFMSGVKTKDTAASIKQIPARKWSYDPSTHVLTFEPHKPLG
jgi:tetratricopeptide (TPR) repeat protein